MAEIMSVLFFNTMRYKISAPRDPSADRFILSKVNILLSFADRRFAYFIFYFITAALKTVMEIIVGKRAGPKTKQSYICDSALGPSGGL